MKKAYLIVSMSLPVIAVYASAPLSGRLSGGLYGMRTGDFWGAVVVLEGPWKGLESVFRRPPTRGGGPLGLD